MCEGAHGRSSILLMEVNLDPTFIYFFNSRIAFLTRIISASIDRSFVLDVIFLKDLFWWIARFQPFLLRRLSLRVVNGQANAS